MVAVARHTGKLQEQVPVIHVVLICEDAQSALHALRTFRRIRLRMRDAVEFEFNGWEYPTLERIGVCLAAAQQMEKADMIIVSAHTGELIPDGVKSAFDLLPMNKKLSRCGLMKLLDRPDGEHSSLSRYLRQQAVRSQLDYIESKR